MRRLLGMVLLALVLAAPARADSDLLVGLVDDQLKWTAHPKPTTTVLRDLGIGALRVPLTWRRGTTRLTRNDVVVMNRIVNATFPMRIVLTVAGPAREAPRSDAERTQFCSYVRDALVHYPTINDVTIWNEVNSNDFWQPQFEGGASVGAARVRVPARALLRHAQAAPPSAQPHDRHLAARERQPVRRLEREPLARALRAQARRGVPRDGSGPGRSSTTSAITRTATSRSRAPSRGIRTPARSGRATTTSSSPRTPRRSPAPTSRRWAAARGSTTSRTASRRRSTRRSAPLYSGVERARTVGSDSLHAAQLVDAVRFAYCQPYVASFFNFLLTDESRPSQAGSRACSGPTARGSLPTRRSAA